MAVTSMLEIIELENGDIVLRRADDDSGEPLVRIQFAEQVRQSLEGHYATVAKAMINAGLHAVEGITTDISHHEVMATIH